MIQEIELLRILSVLALVLWIWVDVTTLKWFIAANGTRPLLMGFFCLGVLASFGCIALVLTSLLVSETTLTSDLSLVANAYILRGVLIGQALVVWSTGRHIMHKGHNDKIHGIVQK